MYDCYVASHTFICLLDLAPDYAYEISYICLPSYIVSTNVCRFIHLSHILVELQLAITRAAMNNTFGFWIFGYLNE